MKDLYLIHINALELCFLIDFRIQRSFRETNVIRFSVLTVFWTKLCVNMFYAQKRPRGIGSAIFFKLKLYILK